MAKQSPPLRRALRYLGHPAQVQRRLAADYCGGCHHEPLRNSAAGRIGRALQQGNRSRLAATPAGELARSEEHTSELQSLMRISYAVFCLKKKQNYRPDHINKNN